VPVRPVLAGQRTLVADNLFYWREGKEMNDFFDLAILYACVFLLGLGLPWFFRNSYWDRGEKRENKKTTERKKIS
jgi:hypothetical protein